MNWLSCLVQFRGMGHIHAYFTVYRIAALVQVIFSALPTAYHPSISITCTAEATAVADVGGGSGGSAGRRLSQACPANSSAFTATLTLQVRGLVTDRRSRNTIDSVARPPYIPGIPPSRPSAGGIVTGRKLSGGGEGGSRV